MAFLKLSTDDQKAREEIRHSNGLDLLETYERWSKALPESETTKWLRQEILDRFEYLADYQAQAREA